MSRLSGRLLALALLLGAAPAALAGDPGNWPTTLPDIIAPLVPAVVNISVLKQRPGADGRTAQGGEDMPRPREEVGSGFIIDPAGYIVTNRHVIDGSFKVTVTLNDNTAYPATVLAANQRPDLALLKVEAGQPLPSVHFGDSDAIRLGETVVAIGNPLGLSSSISVGVVSAVNRDVNSTMIDDFIQTDAAINHGNSGGPLFNLAGEVIGVNWALVAPGEKSGSSGLGLAIPANDAAFVVDHMRRYGHLRSGWLGVRVQQLYPALAAQLGLSSTRGGILTYVWPDGPADRAGLREGDVLLRFGSHEARDVRAMLRDMSHAAPGEQVAVLIWRADHAETITVTMESWRGDASQFDPVGPPVTVDRGPRVNGPDLGLRLGLTPDAERGVEVLGVAANSIAADAGLAADDVILRVQDARVSAPEQVANRFDMLRFEGYDAAMLLVRSGDRPHWITVPLQEPP